MNVADSENPGVVQIFLLGNAPFTYSQTISELISNFCIFCLLVYRILSRILSSLLGFPKIAPPGFSNPRHSCLTFIAFGKVKNWGVKKAWMSQIWKICVCVREVQFLGLQEQNQGCIKELCKRRPEHECHMSGVQI